VSPKPGEIYLVDLGMAAKVRPAVVVSRHNPDSPRALALLVPLSTEYRNSNYEVPLGKLRFLTKASWANTQGTMSVGHERLLRPLGSVTTAQLAQIKAALRYALDL
jgi:mRNA interferase MazF